MSLIGVVTQVDTEYVSASLAEAAVATDTTITLDSIAALPPSGTIRLQGFDMATGDDVTEDIDYTAVDEETLLVTLDGALANDYDADSDVLVLPLQPQTWAVVDYDADNEPTSAFVPENFCTTYYPAFEDGIYEPGFGAEVVVEEVAGVNTIVRVTRSPSAINGAAIDPGTTVPPGALTDGIPPAASPTPVVEQFAIGGIRWSVTPAANADPVRFRVYADTVDPPTIDSDHLVADTGSLSGTFAAIDGVALLPADPTAAPDPIYVAVIEYDADGDGPVSATSSPPVVPRRAGVSEIGADYIYGGAIEANQIQAGTFLADLAMIAKLAVGRYIDIDGTNSSITIYADEAHTQPLVQLRPEGSVFRGQVIADDVSVLNGLILQGTASHIAPSAGMTLDNVIQDPGVAPTLAMTASTQALPAPPAGYTQRGICWDATLDGGSGGWLRLITKTAYATGTSKVQRIYGSPLTVQSEVTLSGGSEDFAHTIVKVGSNYFTMGPNYPEGGTDFYIYKWTTAGAVVAKSTDTFSLTNGYPALGTDGTDVLVGHSADGDLLVTEYSPSTLAPGGAYYYAGSVIPGALGFIGRGSFDFGADRFVAGTVAGGVYVFSESVGTLTEVTAKAFTAFPFLGWNGINFHGAPSGAGAVLEKYSSYYPSASQAAYVSYADTDTGSSKHTKDSPLYGTLLTARRYVQASLPPAPTGAATPRVYMGLDTAPPADTALLKRAETVTNRVILIDPSVAGGLALVRAQTVTNRSKTAGGVATLTINGHGWEVGDTITITGVAAGYNVGPVPITAVTANTFSYQGTGGAEGSTASTGTVTNTDTNTFGAGTAAWIKSQVGGLELYGDGALKVGGYRVDDAWTAFTPTWSGGTIGNGSISAAYKRIGKTVHFWIQIVAGTTTTWGTTLSLPFAITAAISHRQLFEGTFLDASVPAAYWAGAIRSSTTTILPVVDGTTAGGPLRSLTSTVPVTVATGDALILSGTYETDAA